MSIILRIRDKFSWIIVSLLAVSMIAFILEDGLSSGSSLLGGSSENIGKIDGQAITKKKFDEDISIIEKANPNATRDEIIPYVWQNTVSKILFIQHANDAGIFVDKKEIDDIIFSTEGPFAREFTDQKTGEFKINDLRASLAQLKKSKDEQQKIQIEKLYIEPAIQQRLALKYQVAIQQAVYVPKWYIEKEQKDNNLIAKVNYTFENFNELSSAIKVNVEEKNIKQYINEHPNLFVNENNSRTIRYVKFSITPSSYDSQVIKEQVQSLKSQLIKAKTADDVQKIGSLNDVQFIYNKDIYNPKDKIKPTIKDSNLADGKVIGPFIEGNTYEIDKVVSIKKRADSASVRHILLTIQDPQTGKAVRTEEEAKRLVDSIENALKNGADFNTLCSRYSEDPGSNQRGGVYDYFGQGFMVTEFNDFTFDNPVGHKGVVKTSFGYHYIEILKQKDFATMYNIAYLNKALVPGTETINEANNLAAAFSSQCTSGKQLDTIAKTLGYFVESARNIQQNDYTIATIPGGSAKTLVKWAYENDIDDVSEPIQIGDFIYIATISDIVKKGQMKPKEAKEFGVENLVKNELLSENLKEKTKNLVSLKDKSKYLKKNLMVIDSIKFSNPFVPNLGYEPKFTGACFNNNYKIEHCDSTVKSSPYINGTLGVFSIQVCNIKAGSNTEDLKTLRENLTNKLKSSMNNFVQKMTSSAQITDNRYLYY